MNVNNNNGPRNVEMGGRPSRLRNPPKRYSPPNTRTKTKKAKKSKTKSMQLKRPRAGGIRKPTYNMSAFRNMSNSNSNTPRRSRCERRRPPVQMAFKRRRDKAMTKTQKAKLQAETQRKLNNIMKKFENRQINFSRSRAPSPPNGSGCRPCAMQSRRSRTPSPNLGNLLAAMSIGGPRK